MSQPSMVNKSLIYNFQSSGVTMCACSRKTERRKPKHIMLIEIPSLNTRENRTNLDLDFENGVDGGFN